MAENEQQLVAAVGLQTVAINALVTEMRADREARRLIAIWHASVAVIVGVTCFAGLWLLLPAGLVVIK